MGTIDTKETKDTGKKEIKRLCYIFHNEVLFLPEGCFTSKMYSSTEASMDKVRDYIFGNN